MKYVIIYYPLIKITIGGVFVIRKKNEIRDIKIAYIGGGSRGWAWTLMNDLAKTEDTFGSVYLYDIDYEAAQHNEVIGNKIGGGWKYVAAKTAEDALRGADFVIISILPATFDEMEYDVHSPEKYGIYQSVGDTTGPGGFFRALRTVPMIREIARAVKQYCPHAWVINYTNPMAICVKTLYKEFPEIKAFGCCHEVFGTQKLLSQALEDIHGIKDATREDICVNVVGINHFTWFTSAKYKNIDLFDTYTKFVDKYYDTGFYKGVHSNWANSSFSSAARVRFDLFRRFGYIAAAGDRHLAEFCDRDEYLTDPETVKKWTFGLTTVEWRKKDLVSRLEKSQRLLSGEEKFKLHDSGEEGVNQIRALLGLDKLVTNVNLPNRGQIANLPLGSVVETNAVFSADSLTPVMAGAVPESIYNKVAKANAENDGAVAAAFSEDLNICFDVFCESHLLKDLTYEQKKALFEEMYEGTKKYLGTYRLSAKII